MASKLVLDCINGEEGYLLPTWARKIACQRFDRMLQAKVKKWTNTAIAMHWGQRSIRITPPYIPPHHSSPATRDFQSSRPKCVSDHAIIVCLTQSRECTGASGEAMTVHAVDKKKKKHSFLLQVSWKSVSGTTSHVQYDWMYNDYLCCPRQQTCDIFQYSYVLWWYLYINVTQEVLYIQVSRRWEYDVLPRLE